MADNSSLLIATQNPGKLVEFQSMLAMIPLRLRSLREFPGLADVEETGLSFRENAILKAEGYASQTGLLTLADDSGLEVDALGGAPGLYSARYAGDQALDTERVNKLLAELTQTQDSQRRARFVCAIAIFDSTNERIVTFEGQCEGQIAMRPSGSNGFGYDPIFIPDGYSESFGKLSTSIKERVSHRGRALRAAAAYLRDLFDGCA